MRIPQPPPDTGPILDEMLKDPGKLGAALTHLPSAAVVGRYLPWDQFRNRPVPQGLTHAEWWCAVKLGRSSMLRELPLEDARGRPFTYVLPDQVLRAIEALNRDAGGTIGVNEQVTNPATRDRYLVTSLIEEAITSSQLEGASTTRQVASAMIRSGRPPGDLGERMILNNYLAMRHVRELVQEPLTPDLVLEVHRIVTEGTLDDPAGSGRLQLPGEPRVGIYDNEGTLLHQPPPAAELPARLARLCDFANGRTDRGYVPAVIRAIAIHFMLAYDHPFADGNGRTARALFYWSMLKQGFWLTEFVSISRILRGAPGRYGRSFLHTEQDENDLTHFAIYQLEVLERAFADLNVYLDRKLRELRDMQRSLAALPGEFNHRQIALLRHATRHPDATYTVVSHGTSHDVVRETARQDLLALEVRGLLERRRVGKGHVWRPAADLPRRLDQRERSGRVAPELQVGHGRR
jgi:Fic family protein